MSGVDKIFLQASQLNPTEKLILVDKLLASLHPLNRGAEAVWLEEAQERIVAYDEGRVPSISAQNVLKKYDKPS